MAKDRVGEIEDINCVRCGVTKHTLRGTCEAHWDDDEAQISAGSTYDLLQCNGCQRATLRDTSWFSEEPGETSATFWPPRKADSPLREPKNYENLVFGSPVDSVYRQTITAFNHGSSTLAGAGVRLLVEGVCRDKGILKGRAYTDQGKLVRDRTTKKIILKDNLEGKINGLRDKGHISKTQAVVFHELRKLGNDAAHELDQPSLKLVEECIDAVEHLFKQVYDQPDLLKKLRDRKKPDKKPKT